jgi:hypothetical protein
VNVKDTCEHVGFDFVFIRPVNALLTVFLPAKFVTFILNHRLYCFVQSLSRSILTVNYCTCVQAGR